MNAWPNVRTNRTTRMGGADASEELAGLNLVRRLMRSVSRGRTRYLCCPEPVDDGILSCCRTPCTLSSTLQPRRFYTPVIVPGETALGLANNRLFTLGKFSRHIHTATWQLQANLRICPHTSKPSFLTWVDGFVDTPARIFRTELDS